MYFLLLNRDHLLSTYAKFSEKLTYPLIRTPTCALLGGKKCQFLENFAHVLNEWSLTELDANNFGDWYMDFGCSLGDDQM